MADPISSLNSTPNNACIDDDGEAASPVAPSQSVVTASPTQSAQAPTEAPSGTQSLVQRFSSTAPSLPAVAPSSPPETHDRHTMTSSSGAVPGGGSYRVSASLLKDEYNGGMRDGTNAEVGTASVQWGKQNDAQLVGLRSTIAVNRGGYGLSVTTDAGVIRANFGEDNDDGSVGGNIGSGVELAGGEATVTTPAGSLTYGLSVSASLSGSMGVRDADHDGDPEYCAKFSIPAVTLGACVERFW